MASSKDEKEREPAASGRERTTPYGAPDPSQATTDWDLTELALRPLRERYELLGELGRGGMGIVYRARDRETGDVVALKVLQPDIAQRPEVIERFKAELLLARKITHKNVCRTYELLRFGDTAAIAMEYVEGESLRTILSRLAGVSLRSGLEWVRQICSALAEAHAQGVVHRDLKPENILLARDGAIKVMDFGIARSLEADATKTGTLIGTPAYMSPEQVEGKPVDPRSDIYALGLIMHEMFTGQPAFQADTPVAVAMKRLHEAPPPPRSLEPDLPERLDRAIQKCLAKDPKKRFQSVPELEAALSEQPAPTPEAEGEPLPAPALLSFRKMDWALLVLALMSFLYCFLPLFAGRSARDCAFPASKMQLEVDAVAAGRVAEELAAKVGQPFPPGAPVKAQLEFRRDVYVLPAVPEIFGLGLGGDWANVETRWLAEPLAWRLTFSPFGDGADNWVVVDGKGKVERLALHAEIPGKYEVPSTEEHRALAVRTIEMACGPLPANLELRETSGGEQGASYTARWKPRMPPEAPPIREVSFLAEKVVHLDCKSEAEYSLLSIEPPVQEVRWLMGTVAGILLLILFALGRCYQAPWMWRRLPLAAVLGLAAVWFYHTGVGSPGLPLGVYLLEITAASGLALIGLVTAEHYLRRRAGPRVASYVLAWRGRVTEPTVGLAIVRGALAGLVLFGLQTLVAHVGAALTSSAALRDPSRWPSPLLLVLSVVVDPAAVEHGVVSFSPGLYAIAGAVFSGIVVALIFLGLPWSLYSWNRIEAPGRRTRFRAVLLPAAVLWFSGFHLYLGDFLWAPMGWIWLVGVQALILTWLLKRYDVLTVMAAVSTTALFVINYPLLAIFSELGNATQWAVFVAWGLLVSGAAAVALQSNLQEAWRRLTTAFQ